MFKFVTTTIVNKNEDFQNPGKPLIMQAGENEMKIARHGNFKKANTLAIYKRAASAPELAEVKITIPSTLKAGFYRIALYVRLSGNNNSYYANDFVFKGKPFYIEFQVDSDNETASVVAAKIVKIAKKYMTMVYEKDLLEISAQGAVVDIKAIDEYQRLTKVELQWFNTEAGIETFRGFMGQFQKYPATIQVVKVGKEGFGTYSYLIKDHRLPTAANTRWTGIIKDETPIPGATYNQYSIYYCVNRGIMGGDAVGEVTKSITLHVFYVNTAMASQFEQALAKIGDVTEVTGILKDELPADVLEKRVAALEAKASTSKVSE